MDPAHYLLDSYDNTDLSNEINSTRGCTRVVQPLVSCFGRIRETDLLELFSLTLLSRILLVNTMESKRII